MKTTSARKLFILGILSACIALLPLVLGGCSGKPAAAIDGLEVRDTVNDYSWDELSRLSAAMHDTGSEDGAIALAKTYHLTKSNGKLDGTQAKDLVLADGTTVQVQVAGFCHDDLTDGSKAGISFVFKDAIAVEPMYSPEADSVSGWEQSSMRTWLNDEWMANLPQDLQDVIVPASKYSNNVGETQDLACVTPTSDKLWLLSNIELEGKVDFEKARKAYEDIWNAEGSQYQIYDDIGIAWMAPSKSSIKNLLTPDSSVDGGKPCGWWLRTSCPDDAGKFRRVGEDGALGKANAGQNAGVAPGFCL
jgi:hypothetical protein